MLANVDVGKLVQGLSEGHHEEIEVLIGLLEEKARQVRELE